MSGAQVHNSAARAEQIRVLVETINVQRAETLGTCGLPHTVQRVLDEHEHTLPLMGRAPSSLVHSGHVRSLFQRVPTSRGGGAPGEHVRARIHLLELSSGRV